MYKKYFFTCIVGGTNMKKAGVVILTIIIILFVIFGCVMWYKNATKVNGPGNTTQTPIEIGRAHV